GLRIFSEGECVGGPLEDDAAESAANRDVDLFEPLPRGGEILRQRFPHPDGLAALAREHKSDGHVLSVNDCTEIAPKDTSIPVLSRFAASGNVATTLFPLDSRGSFRGQGDERPGHRQRTRAGAQRPRFSPAIPGAKP